MKPALLILAAGIGSRYGGLKQLDRIGPSGETIIDYSIFDARRAGFGKVIFIIKEAIEKDFNEAIVNRLKHQIEVDYVFQEIWKVPEGITIPENRSKPWGTGHAVLMAEGKIDTPFAVINGDDFYGREAFQALSAYYHDWTPERGNDFCMAGYRVGNTLSEYGAVSRGVCQAGQDALLIDVTERTHIERKASGVMYRDDDGIDHQLDENTIVSMNFWGFTPSLFPHLRSGFDRFIHERFSDPKAEYFIPSVVNTLIESNQATVRILPCNARWFGMTYQEDRPAVVSSIRELVAKGIYPEKLWR